MRLVNWLGFGLIFSVVLIGCKNFPQHEVCQLKVDESGVALGAYCAKTDKPGEVKYRSVKELDGYILRHPSDERTVIEWVKRECTDKRSRLGRR